MKRVKHFLHVEWGGDSHAGRHSEYPFNPLQAIMGGNSADERAGDFACKAEIPVLQRWRLVGNVYRKTIRLAPERARNNALADRNRLLGIQRFLHPSPPR